MFHGTLRDLGHDRLECAQEGYVVQATRRASMGVRLEVVGGTRVGVNCA